MGFPKIRGKWDNGKDIPQIRGTSKGVYKGYIGLIWSIGFRI